MKNKIFIIIGLLLIAVALCLTIYFNLESKRAGEKSKEIVKDISKKLETEQVMEKEDIDNNEVSILKINGESYLGIIQIPKLNLELPIMSQWNYANLKISPCRYRGSIEQNNIVICAHNYESHFGKLGRLSINDEVLITNMDGIINDYKVRQIEKVNSKDINKMLTGSWDLTLFTCNRGGNARLAVRCDRK